jgi:hypothetical protein
MPKTKIVVGLEKPIINNFLTENNCNVVREDDTHIFIIETPRNRYKGDDETVVYALSNEVLVNYSGNYIIVWAESDY